MPHIVYADGLDGQRIQLDRDALEFFPLDHPLPMRAGAGLSFECIQIARDRPSGRTFAVGYYSLGDRPARPDDRLVPCYVELHPSVAEMTIRMARAMAAGRRRATEPIAEAPTPADLAHRMRKAHQGKPARLVEFMGTEPHASLADIGRALLDICTALDASDINRIAAIQSRTNKLLVEHGAGYRFTMSDGFMYRMDDEGAPPDAV